MGFLAGFVTYLHLIDVFYGLTDVTGIGRNPHQHRRCGTVSAGKVGNKPDYPVGNSYLIPLLGI